MSAASHTRGPWQVLPPEADKPYLRIRGTRLGHRFKIANVHAEPNAALLENLRDRETAETLANALLIAAAPELLAALIWFVKYDDTIEGMPGNEFWEAGLNAGRAAIAKALPVTTKDAEVSNG